MPLAWGWVSAGVMKPWPTSGPIMRSRSQKAREAMSSRNSLAASQRNLREGKGGLPKPASFGERRGPFNAETPRRRDKRREGILTRRRGDAEEDAEKGKREGRNGIHAFAAPARGGSGGAEEECPHEWGRPRGHPSLEGYAT